MTDLSPLLTLTDQCVKCGLCLPQCPTYTLSLNENESPRGRISLIQALANGQLETSSSLREHLDHCLQCRRCERICPSQVKYKEILSNAYSLIPQLQKQATTQGQIGLYFLQSATKLKVLKSLISFYQNSGLQFVSRSMGLLKLLGLKNVEQRLPKITNTQKNLKQHAYSKQVLLFTGCSQTLFDHEVIDATIKILNALDIEVVIPGQQNCCGALNQLQNKDASLLIENNSQIFSEYHIDTVLYLSTGCGAYIKEHYDSSLTFMEITDYLSQLSFEHLSFKPLTSTVAVHIPCTQKNVLRQADTTSTLVKHIPGLKLVSLEEHGCCGAGGTTMLEYPEMADEIRQPLLDKTTQANCETLVTTNPGCQIHLQHGFKQTNSAIEVIHPVTQLARQLAD